jgi:2-methylisocitrate lyase-like PEP mutase family enzyme
LRAARSAINASGQKVMLTARAEAILRKVGGVAEALRRLAAYAEAGADVLYAPGLRTPEEVAEVVRVAGKLPVNVLVGWPGFTRRQLEDLGVKRISTGGALALAAWGGFMRAAKDIAEHGRFDAFANPPARNEITAAFE